MVKVFSVPPKSKRDLERIATEILRDFQPSILDAPEALNASKLIDTYLSSRTDWALDVRPELASDVEGYCDPKKKLVVISEETYSKVLGQEGRARYTVCHEFAHVELHGSVMRNRMITMSPSLDKLFRVERSKLKSFVDPEWQADYLAAALLMPFSSMKKIIQESDGSTSLLNLVMSKFLVSRAAAEIRIKQVYDLL